MHIHYFFGACLLTGAVLIPLGAPPLAVIGGFLLVGVINWQRWKKPKS
jgi:hypothetical protein